MTRSTGATRKRGRSLAGVTCQVLSAALVCAVGNAALAQDQSAAAPKDAIFARKILMDAISRNMDELEGITSSGTAINLAEGHDHADMISVMVMAFPHPLPPIRNRCTPNVAPDPGSDTSA